LDKSSEGLKAVGTWIMQDCSSPLAQREVDAMMRWHGPGGEQLCSPEFGLIKDRESSFIIARMSPVEI
jgi:hypothetical protein